jgi:protein-tyrosine-phosphatase
VITGATSSSGRAWSPVGGLLGLACGYFICYIPFVALTKALSSGLLPGVDQQVGGLVLLPAVALGVLIGVPIFLALSGWWRYIGLRRLADRTTRFPSGTMIVAGCFMALIIGTTILNYTFAGVSILFMLLLMRAGTLGLAPFIDTIRRSEIRGYSWAALGFSLLAIIVALGAVDAFALTLGALLSLGAYFAGYIGRFEIMSRVAKTGDEHIDRRYFAEEQISAAVALFALCALFALVGVGPEMQALRSGFTSFAVTPEAGLAVAIGLFYAALYVFGTLIYLDAREYTWVVPVNRSSSVLAALAASYALTWLSGIAPPTTEVLVATAFVLLAVAALSYPQLRGLIRRRGLATTARRLVLFVCGGNTGRSPIAAALARSELAGWDADTTQGVSATSAGVSVHRPGAPMTPEAVAALQKLGVRPQLHGAQPLTRELCERSAAIYCMTEEQRQAVVSIAPAVAEKTFRLDPEVDLPEPGHGLPEAWDRFALRVRDLVRQRLADLPVPQHAAGAV